MAFGRYLPILSLCRLVPEKGLHYLVEAFRGMDTNCRLVIAGGSGGTDDYAEELYKLAAGDDRIIFTGFVKGELLEELLTNAMVFCQASDVEGMALSLLEAMGYGRCCLVSDIPENLEVVTALDGSLVAETFTHSDPYSLREQLTALLPDKERRAKLGDLARQHVRNQIGWDKAVEETEELYLGLPEA
ncbi:MAG: glycosyltransferase family 4 protein [Lachnospiraceae bacterium]|nr:glycosyltransferase family 4 protein [Lachnospiraceae bacterium]